MTATEFSQFVTTLECEAMALSERKRKDYATADILSNFKRMAPAWSWQFRADVAPADVAFAMAALKMDRLRNLRGRAEANESIRDSMLDLVNYIRLALACMQEAAK